MNRNYKIYPTREEAIKEMMRMREKGWLSVIELSYVDAAVNRYNCESKWIIEIKRGKNSPLYLREDGSIN